MSLRAVFLNLFSAEVPSANVYDARGNLCNDPSVYRHVQRTQMVITVRFTILKIW